jgi:hypothetical protein
MAIDNSLNAQVLRDLRNKFAFDHYFNIDGENVEVINIDNLHDNKTLCLDLANGVTIRIDIDVYVRD